MSEERKKAKIKLQVQINEDEYILFRQCVDYLISKGELTRTSDYAALKYIIMSSIKQLMRIKHG